MAGYGRATAEVLATLSQALPTQSLAVDHGTHFNSGDIPKDWDPNFGQYVPCSKCLKPVRGAIAYLRQLAGDKNPSTAGLMKVTASSCGNITLNSPECVLDWEVGKHWIPDGYSDNDKWVQLDFLDKRIIVKEYAVLAWGWATKWNIKRWVLEGRNREDEPWEAIDEQSCALEDRSGPVVCPSSQPDKMYRYLRFHNLGYRHTDVRLLPAVEFFGALVILKNPLLDGTEPRMPS